MLMKLVTVEEGEWAHEIFVVTVNSQRERIFIEEVDHVLPGKRQRVGMMPRGYDDTCTAMDGWFPGWRRKFLTYRIRTGQRTGPTRFSHCNFLTCITSFS